MGMANYLWVRRAVSEEEESRDSIVDLAVTVGRARDRTSEIHTPPARRALARSVGRDPRGRRPRDPGLLLLAAPRGMLVLRGFRPESDGKKMPWDMLAGGTPRARRDAGVADNPAPLPPSTPRPPPLSRLVPPLPGSQGVRSGSREPEQAHLGQGHVSLVPSSQVEAGEAPVDTFPGYVSYGVGHRLGAVVKCPRFVGFIPTLGIHASWKPFGHSDPSDPERVVSLGGLECFPGGVNREGAGNREGPGVSLMRARHRRVAGVRNRRRIDLVG